MTPKRPRDPNQLAKSIIDIATAQKPDRDPTPEEQGKDPAAVALGKKGEGQSRKSFSQETKRNRRTGGQIRMAALGLRGFLRSVRAHVFCGHHERHNGERWWIKEKSQGWLISHSSRPSSRQ
jgi:hypothetical protein